METKLNINAIEDGSIPLSKLKEIPTGSYDDSELRNELTELSAEVSELSEKVENLSSGDSSIFDFKFTEEENYSNRWNNSKIHIDAEDIIVKVCTNMVYVNDDGAEPIWKTLYLNAKVGFKLEQDNFSFIYTEDYAWEISIIETDDYNSALIYISQRTEDFKIIPEAHIPNTIARKSDIVVDPVVWKYICNPCVIKNGDLVPEDLLDDQDALKYTNRGMYIVYNEDSGSNYTINEITSTEIYLCTGGYVAINNGCWEIN